ncbi:3-hydroxyacyl-CoA dehydrogenase NAD-binding domain-containing protein [Solimonas terrae]|uniref:enoyl-CoA hydratase n=1 Tax=Solimonas terrae TaxID=1396819 RepID=A0A6M2BXK7_9GAMM|nr:3-hydroxyacyl-CoA dehydrogenase NAD-binding domain-containing protein [Solimonas terrae]NGY07050.1 3-hydroxyacyl-CoA dehydrogenase [Solimonas terrae]
MTNTIRFELSDDGIALLSIDVPDRPMNVLTPDLQAELAALVERVASSDSIKGAILTSGKVGGFVAGADLKDFVGAYDRGITAAQAAAISRDMSASLRRLESCGKPFVAAINGLALGGGLELCLACHYRVLVDDAKAVVGLPEVNVGLLPGAGGTQRLPRLIGIQAALPLLLQGRSVKPAEALKLGIVHELADADQLIARAYAWLRGTPSAEQPWDRKGYRVPGGAGPLAAHAGVSFTSGTALATGSTQGNYPAPLAILSCVFEGTQLAMDVGLRIESKYFGKLLSGPVARNLMRTLFVNKGAAEKLASRPSGIPKSRVGKLGILGAGMMGAGIAHVAAQVGMQVVLLDSTLELAQKGRDYSARLLARELKKGRTTGERIEAQLARIKATADYADLDACDLVVEAVFEQRDIKAAVTASAEAVLPASATFASNTSTLPITGLAKASKRPQQFIGLHFFSPVERMPLVEVIVGEQTSDETIAKALDFVGQLRKTPIIVHDSPGFFTSRVIMTYTHEGMRMLEDGVAPALIESAGRRAGFPVGPLALSDEVTMALMQSIIKQQEADALPEHHRSTTGRSVIFRMVDELKRAGRRYGGGFYDYPEQEPKRLWSGLAAAYPTSAEQADIDELSRRFLSIMALESARCFEEGVITNPADADLGSVLGIGYPTWTGGVLSYIDTVGVANFVEQCRRLAERCGPRFLPSTWLQERARAATNFHPTASTG